MTQLSQSTLDQLTSIMRQGASGASDSLTRWLEHQVEVQVERVMQTTIEYSSNALGSGDEVIGACLMRVSGIVAGQLLFCFNESSGKALCEILLGPQTYDGVWNELQVSAMKETANILACAYLNSLSVAFQAENSSGTSTSPESACWLPSPPFFLQDFSASILESALVDQATAGDTVLWIQTTFQVDQSPYAWNLMLIPDARSLTDLSSMFHP